MECGDLHHLIRCLVAQLRTNLADHPKVGPHILNHRVDTLTQHLEIASEFSSLMGFGRYHDGR